MNKIPNEYKRIPLNAEQLKEFLNTNLILQTVTWNASDITTVSDDDSVIKDDETEGETEQEQQEHQIYAHGVTLQGTSVCLKILNFRPFFYIRLPNKCSEFHMKKIFETIKFRMGKNSDSVLGYSIEYRVPLYPYTAGTKVSFMKIKFLNMKIFRWTKKAIEGGLTIRSMSHEKLLFPVYESKIDPCVKLFHCINIMSTGIVEIKKGSFTVELEDSGDLPNDLAPGIDIVAEKISRAMVTVVVEYNDIISSSIQDTIAPLKIFSWDIETKSLDGTAFPESKNPDDIIAQIGITLWTYGTSDKLKIIITERECSPVEGAVVIVCKNEKELLKTFCLLTEQLDPDIITGYNTWGYDDNYFWNRLIIHSIQNHGNLLCRITSAPLTLQEKMLSSSAYGDNKFYCLSVEGRETFDLIAGMRRDHSTLDAYSLEHVSSKFLGSHKDDLPYSELFVKLVGSPDDVAIAAKYCIQDTNLVIDLIDKLSKIPNAIEMAKTCHVPMGWLLFRGQQCKIHSLIAKKCLDRNYCMPDTVPNNDVPFQGAKVLTAKRGGHYVPVAGLDFASLYPSIMIAYNLCYSTFVPKEDISKFLLNDWKNDPLLSHKFEDINWIEEEHVEEKTGNLISKRDFSFTFVQNYRVSRKEVFDEELKINRLIAETIKIEDPVGSNQGILPSILTELWEGRKATRKIQKTIEKNSLRYKVLEGKQLSQKLVMNSMYGFVGTGDKGVLSCKEIAASVTAMGRFMISKTVELAQTYYPCRVLYGDSIPGYTKVPIKSIENGIEEFDQEFEDIPVEELRGLWTSYKYFKGIDSTRSEKEYFEPEQMYTKTKNGISRIRKVIRHKAPGKKLFKITMKDGRSVVVTEGHSLIGVDGDLVIPEEVFKIQKNGGNLPKLFGNF